MAESGKKSNGESKSVSCLFRRNPRRQTAFEDKLSIPGSFRSRQAPWSISLPWTARSDVLSCGITMCKFLHHGRSTCSSSIQLESFKLKILLIMAGASRVDISLTMVWTETLSCPKMAQTIIWVHALMVCRSVVEHPLAIGAARENLGFVKV